MSIFLRAGRAPERTVTPSPALPIVLHVLAADRAEVNVGEPLHAVAFDGVLLPNLTFAPFLGVLLAVTHMAVDFRFLFRGTEIPASDAGSFPTVTIFTECNHGDP